MAAGDAESLQTLTALHTAQVAAIPSEPHPPLGQPVKLDLRESSSQARGKPARRLLFSS